MSKVSMRSASVADASITTAKIANSAVSWSKLQDCTSQCIVGRVNAGSGPVGELSGTEVTSVLDVFGSVKGLVPAEPGTAADTKFLRGDGQWAVPSGDAPAADLSYTAATRTVGNTAGTSAVLTLADGSNPGLMTSADFTKLAGIATGANAYVHPNHTGDVTSTADGATVIASAAVTTTKIADDGVTNAKMANMSADTIKGRISSTGDPQDLTASQVRAIVGITSVGSGAIITSTERTNFTAAVSQSITNAGDIATNATAIATAQAAVDAIEGSTAASNTNRLAALGLVGNGTTNDRDALQAAITASQTAGIPLRLPKGTFRVQWADGEEGLTLGSNAMILGAGKGQTIIRLVPPSTFTGNTTYGIYADTQTNLRLEELSITAGGNVDRGKICHSVYLDSCVKIVLGEVESVGPRAVSGIGTGYSIHSPETTVSGNQGAFTGINLVDCDRVRTWDTDAIDTVGQYVSSQGAYGLNLDGVRDCKVYGGRFVMNFWDGIKANESNRSCEDVLINGAYLGYNGQVAAAGVGSASGLGTGNGNGIDVGASNVTCIGVLGEANYGAQFQVKGNGVKDNVFQSCVARNAPAGYQGALNSGFAIFCDASGYVQYQPTAWATSTSYTAGSSYVTQSGLVYKCLTSHTAGTFATDLAAGRWQVAQIYASNVQILGCQSYDNAGVGIAIQSGAIDCVVDSCIVRSNGSHGIALQTNSARAVVKGCKVLGNGQDAPAWATSTSYTAYTDYVYHSGLLYRCLESHTAGTFATDQAAGKWSASAMSVHGISVDGSAHRVYENWVSGVDSIADGIASQADYLAATKVTNRGIQVSATASTGKKHHVFLNTIDLCRDYAILRSQPGVNSVLFYLNFDGDGNEITPTYTGAPTVTNPTLTPTDIA